MPIAQSKPILAEQTIARSRVDSTSADIGFALNTTVPTVGVFREAALADSLAGHAITPVQPIAAATNGRVSRQAAHAHIDVVRNVHLTIEHTHTPTITRKCTKPTIDACTILGE